MKTLKFSVLRNAESGKPLEVKIPRRLPRFRNPITHQPGGTRRQWARKGWQSADRLIRALDK